MADRHLVTAAGRDDVLLHPAVRAVMIFCVAKES
jgi:hypothetical protein